MTLSFTSISRTVDRPCSEIAIVLIDDEEAFRTGLAGILRDDGHEVREYDVTELPAEPEPGPVALLITDYHMPGRDGLAVADAFHTTHPDVPIVLLTAHATRALEAEVAARDFVCLLPKPVDYDELHALLHRLAA